MKTYTESPLPPSRCPQKVFQLREELEKTLAEYSDISQLTAKLFHQMKALFPLDMLFLANPGEDRTTRTFHLYPTHGRSQVLRMEMTDEQTQVILQSEAKVLVRSGDQDDYMITINMLRHHFPDMSFSFIMLRNIINNEYSGVMCLVSKESGVYTDVHAAWLFIINELLTAYWNELSLNLKQDVVQTPWGGHLSLQDLPGMREVQQMVWQVSRQDCPVLLLGETGTGKEIVANNLYLGSARHSAPYIKINCGSIPESLVESELFGHEKGAFTNAVNTVKGRFERADRGMLLLDELGELPMIAQTKLLRVLQEGVIERVGGEREIHVDVRIVAATHRDLLELCEQGRFRYDLLYRLNVFPIYIPALRERPEDIPILLNFFIYRKCVQRGIVDLPKLGKAEMEELCAYSWPGNIRELQNAVDRAVILWDGKKNREFRVAVGTHDVLLRARAFSSAPAPARALNTEAASTSLLLDDVVSAHLRKVLEMTGGRISGKKGAAELLGLQPNTLRAKMKKLGLSLERGLASAARKQD